VEIIPKAQEKKNVLFTLTSLLGILSDIGSLTNKKLTGDAFEIHYTWPLSYDNNDALLKKRWDYYF